MIHISTENVFLNIDTLAGKIIECPSIDDFCVR